MDTEAKALSLAEFIAEQGISFRCERIDARPDSLMEDSARHFRCRIISHRGITRSADTGMEYLTPSTPTHQFTVYFSQGSAHTEDPTLNDVLDCLAQDSAGYENAHSLEDWCSEYGYDTDSRKAEKTYKAVKRQAEQLKRILGMDAYEQLLWNIERE